MIRSKELVMLFPPEEWEAYVAACRRQPDRLERRCEHRWAPIADARQEQCENCQEYRGTARWAN